MEIIYSFEELHEIGKKILDFLNTKKTSKVIAFEGKMGSGKTTLIEEICRQIGVIDEVTSPTFAIINEYATKNSDHIYHFDFYRLKNIQEAIDIGTEDYFYSGNYCFIEWVEIIKPILPENTLYIYINEISENKRKISTKQLTQQIENQ